MTTNDSGMDRRALLRILLAGSAATAMASDAGATPTADVRSVPGHHQPQLRMGSEQIAILVYPEFTALDALGPQYALAGMMGASVRFVAKTADLVPAEGASGGGVRVKPHWTFETCPDRLDLLLVPGGVTGTLAAIEDAATSRFLRDRAAKSKLVGSVCTGSLVLGAAGLLRGRQATCHWQLIDVLEAAGATPVSRRVVFDGEDRVTAAGVSAGLDLGLELVRRYRGDLYAQGMQLLGEYDPQPPFPGGGHPRTADKVAVEMLNGMHAPLIPMFRAAVEKARATWSD